MTLWERLRPAAAAPSPSDAARTLAAAGHAKRHAQHQARVAATTDRLRNCVAAGRIAHLGWKHV